ncbi:MAG TPA: MASE1 domain-containing protein [Vicinamibacterales bacterium]
MEQTTRLDRRWNSALIVSFAALYFLAVRLSEGRYGTAYVSSPFWLPDSILLCALLLTRRTRWWILALIVCLIRFAAGGAPGTPAWFSGISIANDLLKGLGAAWILQRLLGDRIRLNTLQEFLVFLGVAAGVMPLLSTLAVAPARYPLGDALWSGGFRWFLGDALAQVVVTPMILYWWWAIRASRQRIVELSLLVVLLGATTFYAFGLAHTDEALSLMYVPVPFLIWAAVRLRPLGTSTAIVVVATVSIFSASRGIGMFAADASRHSVLTLQLFLLLIGVSMLSLAIVVEERQALRARESAFNTRLLQAQDGERARIALELHDDILQRIAILQIGLDAFGDHAASTDARLTIGGFRRTVAEISSAIRGLSRKLHPSVLDVVALDLAIKELCREFTAQHRMNVQFRCESDTMDVDRVVKVSVFRIAQEALHNAAKHSGTAAAVVELARVGDRLVLSVTDAGVGFDVGLTAEAMGLGFISMRERLRPLGGNLVIQSVPGQGTTVRVDVPLQIHDRAASLVEFDVPVN